MGIPGLRAPWLSSCAAFGAEEPQMDLAQGFSRERSERVPRARSVGSKKSTQETGPSMGADSGRGLTAEDAGERGGFPELAAKQTGTARETDSGSLSHGDHG